MSIVKQQHASNTGTGASGSVTLTSPLVGGDWVYLVVLADDAAAARSLSAASAGLRALTIGSSVATVTTRAVLTASGFAGPEGSSTVSFTLSGAPSVGWAAYVVVFRGLLNGSATSGSSANSAASPFSASAAPGGVGQLCLIPMSLVGSLTADAMTNASGVTTLPTVTVTGGTSLSVSYGLATLSGASSVTRTISASPAGSSAVAESYGAATLTPTTFKTDTTLRVAAQRTARSSSSQIVGQHWPHGVVQQTRR